jgi:C1A family cysteine protease
VGVRRLKKELDMADDKPPRKKRISSEDVAAIRNVIREKGFDWQPAENPVSRMPEDQQKKMLGYHEDPTELQFLAKLIGAANDFHGRISTGIMATPPSIDWRSHNGSNWMTAVRDQSSCGSCVSFGTLAAIEARVKIECKSASLQPDYSEAHLFFCGCGSCCDTGWNFAPSLDFCQNTGIAREASWPYQPQYEPCPSGIPVIGKITSWKRALSQEERFSSLNTYGPMVAGMAVYSDFYAYQSGVYRRTSEDKRGYHAVCVLGYNKAGSYWICKNSWGTSWGESGYFRIGFGECEMDTTFPFYEVQVPCLEKPTPTVTCRQYVPYLVRVIQVARMNPAFRACLIYYICRRPPRPPRCPDVYLRVIKSVSRILETCPQYRRPFCGALD